MSAPTETVTFWYGCNAVRHGDILRASIALLEAIGVEVRPAGGPAYCCGTAKDGNLRAAAGMAHRAVDNFNALGHDVVTWCPSCHRHMTNFIEHYTQPRFELNHITQRLHAHRDILRARIAAHAATHPPSPRRAMVHQHIGFHEVDVNRLVRDLLALVPGLELVDASDAAPGHMCSALAAVPAAANEAAGTMSRRAREQAVDHVITIWHSCHRMLCALEATEPFRIVNYVTVLAAAMGLQLTDEYQRWKLSESDDAIVAAVGPERVRRIGETVFRTEVLPELARGRPPTR